MSKHNTRDHRGRWAKTESGAPIPDESGQGDTSAYDRVDALSGRPGGDPEMFPSFRDSYPTREFTHPDGSYSPLRGRKQIVVNAQTGEALDAHITHVRAVDARSNFGTGQRVVTVTDSGLGGEFGDATYPSHSGPDTVRGYRNEPGSNGYRLPSKGMTDDAPKGAFRSDAGGLFRTAE